MGQVSVHIVRTVGGQSHQVGISCQLHIGPVIDSVYASMDPHKIEDVLAAEVRRQTSQTVTVDLDVEVVNR